MNVAFDSWIPIVKLDGKPKTVSLCDIFTDGHNLADLAVRPHERVALMRLFLCVAHAALDGPKNLDEWDEVPKKLPGEAKRYLDEWNKKEVFELFHKKKPFLQVATLRPKLDKNSGNGDWGVVSKLEFAFATGAASTLFDHPANSTLPRNFNKTDIPRMLLPFLNFSTCGLISQVYWNGDLTVKSAKDAPCISGSMYHLFVRGENLFNTVHLNLIHFEELSLHYKITGDHWIGHPIWEKMPQNINDNGSAYTFLGRLVPITRAVLFRKNCSFMLMGEGLRYPVYPDFPREVSTSENIVTIKKKSERIIVGAKTGQAIWRELPALLQYDQLDKPGRALTLNNIGGDMTYDIWVGALIRKPGKQDILDTIESVFHISKNFRSNHGFGVYRAETKKIRNIASALSAAIAIYYAALDPTGESKTEREALVHYWTTVEKNLPFLMAHIEALDTSEAEPKLKKWRAMLHKAAKEAYRLVCGQKTPRQMRAFALGWKKLSGDYENKQAKEINNKQEEGEE